MWRLLSALLLLAAITIAGLSVSAKRAYACSAGPDYDPVAASDVIVKGRFLGYEVLPDAPLPGLAEDDPKYDFTRDAYVPVRVDMAVERVLKGQVQGSIITLVDPVSLEPPYPGHDTYEWIGASGACGAFDWDPTGKYAVMGLFELDDGTYRPHRMLWFSVGDSPQGEWYQYALERIASFPGAAGLPALGSGPAGSSGASAATIVAAGVAAAAGIALLGTSAAVRVRGRRSG
jgi:hypothetical protein